MGNRIFSGFRLDTDSFADALKLVNEFRPWVVAKSEQMLDSFIANITKEDGVDFVTAFDRWQERRRFMRIQQTDFPAVDTEFSIVLVPYSGGLLGRVYTAQRPWREQWYAHPGVREYSYWDNEEPPEDVTAEDWAARAEAWAIITDRPMAMQGFAIDLVSPEGPMPKQWRRP